MRPALRKAMLALHLTVSVGWIGGVVAYLVLGITAASSADAASIRSAWLAKESIGWYAIVPLAVCSLATGIVMAAGTRWGLFRHYWVIVSLTLTSISVAVLLLHMPSVTATAELARTAPPQELSTLGGDLTHPAIGLLVLLVVQVLNVYKPRGRTRYAAGTEDDLSGPGAATRP